MAEQNVGRILKRATKEDKLWRAMVTHVPKRHAVIESVSNVEV